MNLKVGDVFAFRDNAGRLVKRQIAAIGESGRVKIADLVGGHAGHAITLSRSAAEAYLKDAQPVAQP